MRIKILITLFLFSNLVSVIKLYAETTLDHADLNDRCHKAGDGVAKEGVRKNGFIPNAHFNSRTRTGKIVETKVNLLTGAVHPDYVPLTQAQYDSVLSKQKDAKKLYGEMKKLVEGGDTGRMPQAILNYKLNDIIYKKTVRSTLAQTLAGFGRIAGLGLLAVTCLPAEVLAGVMSTSDLGNGELNTNSWCIEFTSPPWGLCLNKATEIYPKELSKAEIECKIRRNEYACKSKQRSAESCQTIRKQYQFELSQIDQSINQLKSGLNYCKLCADRLTYAESVKHTCPSLADLEMKLLVEEILKLIEEFEEVKISADSLCDKDGNEYQETSLGGIEQQSMPTCCVGAPKCPN